MTAAARATTEPGADEPILDVYAYPEPWQVPPGTFEQITESARALMHDERAGGSPEVVRIELSRILDYLFGIGAVRSGTRAAVGREILGPLADPPQTPQREPGIWTVSCTAWRPPYAFDLHSPEWFLEHKQDAAGLAEDGVRIFEPLVPLRERLDALLDLYAKVPADPAAFPQDLRKAWAEAADDAALSRLPELAGPIDHLGWIADGLTAAHEFLRDAVPAPESPIAGISGLLRALELDTPPAELTAALGERAARVLVPCDVDSPAQWTRQTRSWLARAVAAGQEEAARTWVDMAVRFVCAVRGLPNEPVDVDDYVVQIGGFTFDRIRLTRPRRATENPIAARLARRAPNPAGPDPRRAPETAAGRSAGAGPDGPRTGDRPRRPGRGGRRAARPRRPPGTPVRLLISGPDGTGKHDLALELARLMRGRGLKESPLWISEAMFARQSDAVSTFHKTARDCVGERLLMIENLDLIALDPQNGPSLAEELHRLLDVYEDLHVVAMTEQGGEEQLRRVNPAIMQRLDVIHTRPFDELGYAELFTRAVAQRGGRTTRPAATAAGPAAGAHLALPEPAQRPARPPPRRNRAGERAAPERRTAAGRAQAGHPGARRVPRRRRLRRPAGRTARHDRDRRGQGRGRPLARPVRGRAPAPGTRRRPARAGAPPRADREPRHRQDPGGAAGRADLQEPRRALLRASGRGLPGGPGGRLRRPDRRQDAPQDPGGDGRGPVHRRGLRADRRHRQRLRPRGGQRTGPPHGGRARRAHRHRRGIRSRDAPVPRRESRPGLPLPHDAAAARLHRRATAADPRIPGRRRGAEPRAGRAGEGRRPAAQADPRPLLRQRPADAQRPGPGDGPAGAPPVAHRDRARPGRREAAGRGLPGDPQRPDPQQAAGRPVGRTGVDGRTRGGEEGDPDARRRRQGGEHAPRGRPAGDRPGPAHGLHRQPGHRQDGRGTGDRGGLRPTRPALLRPPRRGLARGPGGRLHRPDGAEGRGRRRGRRSAGSCSSTRPTRSPRAAPATSATRPWRRW